MTKPAPPKLTKFPAAKQRRMDELLEKNAEGTITPTERSRLEHLVAEAEHLMVANAKLLAEFSKQESPKVPVSAVPLTVWVKAENAGR